MARRFRWLPHDGKRHAVPAGLAAGTDGTTLCGLAVTVPATSPPRHPHGCWPTCTACDTAWRRAEGIPLPAERGTRNVRASDNRPAEGTTAVVVVGRLPDGRVRSSVVAHVPGLLDAALDVAGDLTADHFEADGA
ncbi:zinc finger protein [Saccharothrix violaceirubra]|uniref:Zinc finger protein n=1 Tax=Saccharothrix violaceirubra TaxID=413306 RepID=A0A7W7WYN4_9PSEU|nr:zinc finger protein [Saccharothrix violaceirubra]MBB4968402.1 hypothetical protein [Saccharothrix violaceirubra]